MRVFFEIKIVNLQTLTWHNGWHFQVSQKEPKGDQEFSFLNALKDGYFSDVTIVADSGKEVFFVIVIFIYTVVSLTKWRVWCERYLVSVYDLIFRTDLKSVFSC